MHESSIFISKSRVKRQYLEIIGFLWEGGPSWGVRYLGNLKEA